MNTQRRTAGSLQPLVYRPQSTVYGLRPASGGLRPPASILQPTAYSLQPAFTLIELLVVIVVIAILMGITLPVSKYAIARAKAARQEVMLAKIRSALDDYRAAYGEYPITPTTNDPGTWPEASKHYWKNIIPDIDTVSNSIYTNVDLSSNTIEVLALAGGGLYTNDYCLTFPLMLRQEREGKRPFINFDKVTVMYVMYKAEVAGSYNQKRKTKSGGIKIATIKYVLGDPVDRVKAIDPVSSLQWKYTCHDGTSYTITTNTF